MNLSMKWFSGVGSVRSPCREGVGRGACEDDSLQLTRSLACERSYLSINLSVSICNLPELRFVETRLAFVILCYDFRLQKHKFVGKEHEKWGHTYTKRKKRKRSPKQLMWVANWINLDEEKEEELKRTSLDRERAHHQRWWWRVKPTSLSACSFIISLA